MKQNSDELAVSQQDETPRKPDYTLIKQGYSSAEIDEIIQRQILNLQINCATLRGKLGFKNIIPDLITKSGLTMYKNSLERRIRSRTRRGLM